MTTIKPRTATVPIYQGDDLERLGELYGGIERAKRQALEAKMSGTQLMGDMGQSVEDAQAEYDAFVDEAAERATWVVLRAIGGRRWRDLVLEHPKRMVKRVVDGEEVEVAHADDEQFGVNTATFPNALLNYKSDRAVCIAEPEFPSAADRQDFLDDIAAGDFDKLWTHAYYLNTEFGVDPKALRSSATRPISDATS